MHIADHDSKEKYVPGTAHGDKELHSFPVRTGTVRPLGDDDLNVQTSLDVPSDVPWADDVLSAIDAADGVPLAGSVIQSNDVSTRALSDEEYYWEVRGLFSVRIVRNAALESATHRRVQNHRAQGLC